MKTTDKISLIAEETKIPYSGSRYSVLIDALGDLLHMNIITDIQHETIGDKLTKLHAETKETENE